MFFIKNQPLDDCISRQIKVKYRTYILLNHHPMSHTYLVPHPFLIIMPTLLGLWNLLAKGTARIQHGLMTWGEGIAASHCRGCSGSKGMAWVDPAAVCFCFSTNCQAERRSPVQPLPRLTTSTVLRFGPPGSRTIRDVWENPTPAVFQGGQKKTPDVRFLIFAKMKHSYSSSSSFKRENVFNIFKRKKKKKIIHSLIKNPFNLVNSINGLVQICKSETVLSKNETGVSKVRKLCPKMRQRISKME